MGLIKFFFWFFRHDSFGVTVFLLLQALSRRARLYEMIRDYAQAASDLQRLISILNKRVNDKANQHGISDRSYNYVCESLLQRTAGPLARIAESAVVT